MIDLHAHVLPGLDDGPATLQDALALLRRMEEQGVQVVVAAVHALDDRYNVSRDALLRGCESLTAALAEEGLSIRVLPSMELYLSFDLLGAARRGQVVGLNQTAYLAAVKANLLGIVLDGVKNDDSKGGYYYYYYYGVSGKREVR